MYSKLFSSITTSSIWSEDSDTCKVWITMMALQDREGYVFGSIGGLARICALPVEVVSTAIEKFLSPDPDSADMTRAPEREGRRIEVVDGGWRVLNANHYRDLFDADERRHRDKIRKRAHRERSKPLETNGCHTLSHDVSHTDASTPSDSDPSSSLKKKKQERRFAPPTLQEVKTFWASEGLNGDPEVFWLHFENCRWKLSGGTGPVMKDWHLSARKWSKSPMQTKTQPDSTADEQYRRMLERGKKYTKPPESEEL